MVKINQAYAVPDGLKDVMPLPIQASSAPGSSNIKFPLGQIWLDTTGGLSYILAKKASGAATWNLMAPGASDVDTLTGDSGGALAPAGGNITLAGGTNVTSAGAGSTITFNLDAAVTLATSVTAPIYTSAAAMQITPAAANDLDIDAATGQDLILKMGDNAAANKVSFTDSDDAEVASIDSNGAFTTTGLTFTGLFTANASATILTAGTALNLGSDNSGDAVNLGVGTVARAIGIGDSAAAHTLTVGSTTGAASLDLQAGTGNFTLDGAATTTYDWGASTTSGTFSFGGTSQTGTMTIAPSTGTQTIALANADGTKTINIGAGVDGNTISMGNGINTSAQIVNLASGAAAANSTVNILSGAASAGTITLNCANGSRATTVNLASGVGGNTVNLLNGINTSAQTMNMASGANAANSTVNILGGIATAGTQTLNLATGASASAVNIGNATGATAVAITSGTGSLALVSTGTGDITVNSDDTLLLDADGVLELNSSAGAISIGNDADAQAINVGTGAAARTITVGNTTGATGLVLEAGTGDITVTGTVKEIDAEFLAASGDDITFQQSPVLESNASTGAAPTGATGDVNIMAMQNGLFMEEFILGAGQTIIAPRMDATGLLVSGDLTATEGFEYNWGAVRSNSRHAFTIGTSAAFFLEWKFTVADVSGGAPYMCGFRKVEANNATLTSYTDYAMIGIDAVASVGTVVIKTELNSGGTTNTNTTDAWTDGQSHTMKVLVSAAGVVTYTIDGSAPSVTAALTFDNADVIVPFFRLEHQAGAPGTVQWETMKCGFQA